MNYFEVYELPVQLSVDKAVLKKKYLELSRLYHPDYFIQEDDGAQQRALEQSALVNKAFKTLSNPDETIKYVLELQGFLTENEKYELPPDFLMEMMELHEAAAEAHEASEKAAALQTVQQREAELYEPVREVIDTYKEGVTSDVALLQVKAYYLKKKYLERLKQQLGEKS
jgi:molecular chaperone HscB